MSMQQTQAYGYGTLMPHLPRLNAARGPFPCTDNLYQLCAGRIARCQLYLIGVGIQSYFKDIARICTSTPVQATCGYWSGHQVAMLADPTFNKRQKCSCHVTCPLLIKLMWPDPPVWTCVYLNRSTTTATLHCHVEAIVCQVPSGKQQGLTKAPYFIRPTHDFRAARYGHCQLHIQYACAVPADSQYITCVLLEASHLNMPNFHVTS